MKNRTLFLILISFILSLVSCSAMVSDLKDLNKKGDLIVESYFEAVESADAADYSAYKLVESYTVEKISAKDCEPKEYSGLELAKKDIAAEEDNTIVRFYFKRKIINFTLDPDGGTWWDGQSSITKLISGKYEAPVELPQEFTLTKSGFTFVGWEPELPSNYYSDSIFKAVWTDEILETYTVIFDANGGQGQMADQQFTARISQKLSSCTFTKAGYKFAGWATEPYGAKVYENEQSVKISQDITLYAVWTEKTDLTIFYHNFYGVESNTKEVPFKFTDDVTLEIPAKTGYTFGGWYLTQELSGSDVTGWNGGTYETDVNVYAKWEPNVHTITFNSNGGQGQMAPQSFTFGAETTLTVSSFTKVGYTFAGWAKAEDGQKEFDNGAAYTFTTDSDITLYAVWTENGAFEIEYKNIIEGDTNQNQTSYKEKDTVTINPADRTGYDFDGWYYDEALSEGPVTGWAAGEKTGKVTLWAKWTAKTFKITFDKNNGEGTLADQSFAYNETKPLSANTFTRLGYDFAGWTETKADDNSSVSYTDKQDYTFTSDSNVTLFAVWSKRPAHTITYEDGGTHTNPAEFEETDDVTINAASKPGYTFEGWYYNYNEALSEGPVTGWFAGEKTDNVTLWAKWKANTYTVTFNQNGGTGAMEPQSFTYGKTSSLNECLFLKTGYKFAGWGLKADATTPAYGDKASYSTSAQDITLYAIWILEDSLSIIYENTDEKTTNPNASSFYKKDPVSINDASKPGYTFKGWYESSDFTGTTVIGWAAGDKETDVTLYAKWEAKSYSVSFDSNDGTGTMAPVNYVYEKPENLPASGFTKTGYDFAGWSTEKNGTKAYNDQASFVITEPGDVTLFAVWSKRPSHTITYEADGGSHSNSTVFEETDSVTINAAAKTGCSFEGWYYNEALSEGPVTGWSAGEKTDNVTLYAKYKANTYTITFNANDESAEPATSTQTFTYNSPVALKSNTFTRIGYDFTGWAAANDGTKIYDDKASYPGTTAGNVILYAVWNQRAQHSIAYKTGLSETTITGPDKFWEKDSVTLGTAAKTGYTFGGWYETSNFTGSAVTGWSAGQKTEDVTLYAKMVPVSYKVIFDGNTGSGSMTPQSVPFETTVTLKANSFTKTGYDFKGWSTSAGDSTVAYANGTSYTQSVTNDVTLYAVWEIKTYTVTFNANGGIGSMDSQLFEHSNPQALTENSFSRSGYEFAGWSTSSTATKAEYNDKQIVTLTNGNLTLYAVWNSKIGIGITDNITGDLTVKPVVNGTTVTLTATPPYSGNWTYKWYIDDVKQPETTATITKTLSFGTHTVVVIADEVSGKDSRTQSINISL